MLLKRIEDRKVVHFIRKDYILPVFQWWHEQQQLSIGVIPLLGKHQSKPNIDTHFLYISQIWTSIGTEDELHKLPISVNVRQRMNRALRHLNRSHPLLFYSQIHRWWHRMPYLRVSGRLCHPIPTLPQIFLQNSFRWALLEIGKRTSWRIPLNACRTCSTPSPLRSQCPNTRVTKMKKNHSGNAFVELLRQSHCWEDWQPFAPGHSIPALDWPEW